MREIKIETEAVTATKRLCLSFCQPSGHEETLQESQKIGDTLNLRGSSQAQWNHLSL